jgi:hypothetical protein
MGVFSPAILTADTGPESGPKSRSGPDTESAIGPGFESAEFSTDFEAFFLPLGRRRCKITQLSGWFAVSSSSFRFPS